MYIRNTDSTGWDQVYSTANKPSLAAGATQGVTGTLPISSGGTGATVASTALSNLGGMPKTGGAFTGGVTGTTLSLSSALAVTGASTLTGAVTVNNTISQDSVGQSTYGHTSLSSGTAGAKSYLRKMRGGTGDTIFHETVQAGNYRLATGATTDSSDALTLSSTGNLTITGALTATGATLSTPLPIASGGTGSNVARKVNGYPLTSDITLSQTDIAGTVPSTLTVNSKPLSGNIVLAQADIAGTVPTSLTVNGKALTGNITLVQADISGTVPTSRTVNGKALSANIVLAQADIAGSVPNTLTVNGKALSTNIVLAQGDIAGTVPTSRTVNGQALSSNVDLSALDVSAMPYYGTIVAGTNLNTLNGSVYGVYEQPVTANATTALSYPVAVGGTLFVLKSGVTHANSCTQVYYPSSTDDIYNRTGTSNDTGTVTWSAWVRTANITTAGVNSSIKSLTGLTTALSVAQGGTGSNVAATALSNLGGVAKTVTVNSKPLSANIVLNAADVSAVPTTRTINGQVLSDDVVLGALDVNAFPYYGTIVTGTNLNTLNGSVHGIYEQPLSANATVALNYPAVAAGTLAVLKNGLTHANSCTQVYYPANADDIYNRTGTSNSSGVVTWSAWVRTANITSAGVNSTIKSLTGLTTAIPITGGGTGATTAAAALTNLGAVPTSRTINGKPLTGNVVLTQADIEGTVPSSLTINGIPLTGDITLTQGDFSGTIPVSGGGTGATTAAAGLAALGGFALAGGTVTGASTFNSTLTVKNTINQDSVAQSTYGHTSMSTGTAGGKSYLRKFKGGSGSTDATFHETVQGTTYRIATGTTDTTDLLKLSNTGELTTRVIEADEVLAATPPNNFSGAGGLVRSTISAAGAELSAAYMFSVYEKSSSGVETRKARIIASGGSPSIQSYFDIGQDGSLLATNGTFRSLLSIGSPVPAPWWESAQSGKSGIYQNMTTDPVGVSAIGALSWAYRHNGGYELRSMWGNVGNGMINWGNTSLTQFGDSGNAGTRYWYFTPASGDLTCTAGGGWSGSYTFQKAATSDATLKHDIEYNDGKASYENIKKLKPCTFIYNFDPMERERRGIIAQDALRDIDSEYVKLVPAAPEYDDEGNRIDKDDTLALDNNVVMMDTALALNHSIVKIEAMENEIAELRAMIAAINK